MDSRESRIHFQKAAVFTDRQIVVFLGLVNLGTSLQYPDGVGSDVDKPHHELQRTIPRFPCTSATSGVSCANFSRAAAAPSQSCRASAPSACCEYLSTSVPRTCPDPEFKEVARQSNMAQPNSSTVSFLVEWSIVKS